MEEAIKLDLDGSILSFRKIMSCEFANSVVSLGFYKTGRDGLTGCK